MIRREYFLFWRDVNEIVHLKPTLLHLPNF